MGGLRLVAPAAARAKVLQAGDFASCVAPAKPAPVLRRWYTTAQAAEYLGVTQKAVQRYVEKGALVPDKRGRSGGSRMHVFSRETLDGFVLGRQ